MVHYGQVICGPPTSGKSTFIINMKKYLETLNRNVVIVNLDPANDILPYKVDVDVKDFICVQDVMELVGAGPNASLIYCIDMIWWNIQWLQDQLQPHNVKTTVYYLIDCPGQSELFTHNNSLSKIMNNLCEGARQYSFTCVYMIDIQHCCDPSKYLSCTLESLLAMMHIHLPQINAISKFDLLPQYYEDLDFKMDYYLNVMDLDYLIEKMRNQGGKSESIVSSRFYSKISEVIKDYALVTFVPLCSYDTSSLFNILVKIDQANGFMYSQTNVDYVTEIK